MLVGKELDYIETLIENDFRTDIKKRIISYSKKYNVPQDIIANIFIDYDSMRSEYQ
uniref:hypothetical protein n=1 Tax=Candidatus Wunengus sp. YC60 TaxID=3367697 RepID=UPI0040250D8E